MDHDNDNFQPHTPSSAVSKTSDNAASVVRQRPRASSTRHRHTSPAHIHPDDLAGLRISHAFRGFTVTPDVIFDEPYPVPSKQYSRKVHQVIPSPVITAGDTGSPTPTLLVASERLGVLPCQPPNVLRSIADESTSSTQSAGSVILAIDNGHNGLIPTIGTTNKFTHKWPTPKNVSYESPIKNIKDVRPATSLYLNEPPASALEDGQGLGSSHTARWTAFKWCLLLSATTVLAYGATGLICALMTWSKTWDKADVMAVADGDLLVLITWAASMLLLTALIGMTGTLLNSRPILAAYTVLLWPAFISLLSVGYVAYKRDSFSLDHKLNLSWSRRFNSLDRLRIQDSLQCCGFYSTLHAISPSKRCYLRAPLPGCKRNFYNFEHQNLSRIWRAAFALVPLHMFNLVVALLCANHMTNTFGKGITPKQYRLSATDVKADAEKILDGVTSFFRPNASKVSPDIFFKDEKEHLVRSI